MYETPEVWAACLWVINVGPPQDAIDSTSTRIFETTVKDAALKANRSLPPFITTLFQIIEPRSLHSFPRLVPCPPLIDTRLSLFVDASSEGIFRLSGNASKIQELKEQMNRGEEVDLKTVTDINTVTGLLKAYFRDLANPLIPFSFFNKFMAIASTFYPPDHILDC